MPMSQIAPFSCGAVDCVRMWQAARRGSVGARRGSRDGVNQVATGTPGRRASVWTSLPKNAPGPSPPQRRRRSSVVDKWQKGIAKVSALVAVGGMFEGKVNMSEMEEFEEECRKAEEARQSSKKTLEEGGVEALAAEAARLKAVVMASLDYPVAAPDTTPVVVTDEDAAELRFISAERASKEQAALKKKEVELAREEETQEETHAIAAAAAEAVAARQTQDAAVLEAELKAAEAAAIRETAAAAALEVELEAARVTASAATARLRQLEAQVGRASTFEKGRRQSQTEWTNSSCTRTYADSMAEEAVPPLNNTVQLGFSKLVPVVQLKSPPLELPNISVSRQVTIHGQRSARGLQYGSSRRASLGPRRASLGDDR